MKNLNLPTKLFLTILILTLPAIISCAGTGRPLYSHPAQGKNLIPGTYTLVLYGGRYTDDFETAAFLDLEGDDYTIKPFSATFQYRMVKGLDVSEALQTADNFMHSVLTAYNRYEIRQISSPDDSIIGYELRPLLLPFVYGESDVLNISYVLQPDKEVTVYIRTKNRFGRTFFFGRDGGDGDLW
jgi:hypothetical protein